MDASVKLLTATPVEALALTKDLVRIPSINPPGNEEACAKYLAEVLADIGFEVHLHSFGAGRFNLVANIHGRQGGKPIGFTGHFDVVPLGTRKWNFDPFGAIESEGRVYGRGTSDMKGGIAAFVAACSQSIEELREGNGVQLIITGGEETGCDGAKALAGSSGLLKPLSLLLVGEMTANYPFVGHKGALWVRASATGKTAHGAMPEQGDNAIYKATQAIQKIRGFGIEESTHPLMGHATMNVGTFKAGTNVNSVPDRAEFEVDFRTVPGMDHQCVCTRLSRFLTDDIGLTSMVDVPPLSTDPEALAVKRVFGLCESLHHQPIVARAVPYFTDGSVLLPATGNPPTIILGPGEPKMAHQTDEYCYVHKIAESVTLYRSIIQSISNDPL
ncbi:MULTISPECIES: M20 family metallopeptidase [unclassified Caballeronia]|uniref:M20 family metallopeptidase n=1 Tax=unclassified Caballeronia TaxID=2646786 RepID=UPI001F436956|nr:MULTISPECIES: M20 family metallopeptidase [unclassified Caballeronia]MCE4547313.1 M20 family metallopeptidase [Caballeronia sp. PC1]MCE4575296.1 M20 family metallopeptidase [Caballeronia sp. CLC5]